MAYDKEWYLKNRERLLEVRRKYNKEYFARPEVIARAKVRNAERRDKRRAYKKTVKGKEAENRYRRKNFSGDVVQNRRLVKLYNITLEEYKMMLDKQGCACAICGEIPENKLHIDHCHKTDKVRGLLCGSCNRALGLFKDNLDTIEASLIYLKNDL